MIVWLGDDAPPALVGGKAASLAILAEAGLPVPAGFCVTVEAMSKLDSPHVAAAVDKALAALAAPAVAVRSSASEEDGARASFAGIHLTRLNVRSSESVLRALREVRASASSDRALSYRASHGMSGEPRMAALVQTMVDAEASGVLFTRDPISGRQQFVIEAAFGLGEAVVSGAVTPDRFVLSPVSAVLEERVLTRRPCIDAPTLEMLTRLGKRCERLLGSPQDIEWAIANGTAWIVQSRPITGLAR